MVAAEIGPTRELQGDGSQLQVLCVVDRGAEMESAMQHGEVYLWWRNSEAVVYFGWMAGYWIWIIHME